MLCPTHPQNRAQPCCFSGRIVKRRAHLYWYSSISEGITSTLSLWRTPLSISGVLNYETDSLLYANEIVFNEVTFYPADCIKENGAKAKINNVPVIVDISKKVMTDNVRFRTEPSTKAKTQKVWLYDENKKDEYSKTLSAEFKK